MSDKEKLIELLESVEHHRRLYPDVYIDDLIAQGMTVQKHGRWILGHVEPGYFTPGGNRPWVCSECGEIISWRLDKPRENYCPNCGTKMNGKGESNE